VCASDNTNSLSVFFVLVDPLDVVVGQVPLAVRQKPLELLPVRQLGQLLLISGRKTKKPQFREKNSKRRPKTIDFLAINGLN
jgi:hypothetical protein